MSLPAAVEWLAFAAFSVIAIAGALGMTTTMSMFRSGIFLMASFFGVAGLFILLSADLLALLQIMMYVGGMLVMLLFMVRFMYDPGGAMMAGMEMNLLERFFTLGIGPAGGGMTHGEEAHGDQGHDHAHGNGGQDAGMQSMDMSMTTRIKVPAAVLAAVTGLLLGALALVRRAWPLADAPPDPRSAERVGHLLMGQYMMAFEGAGLLILIGIFGAVYLARPGRHARALGRQQRVAVDEPPAPIHARAPQALHRIAREPPELDAAGIHRDENRGKDGA